MVCPFPAESKLPARAKRYIGRKKNGEREKDFFVRKSIKGKIVCVTIDVLREKE